MLSFLKPNDSGKRDTTNLCKQHCTYLDFVMKFWHIQNYLKNPDDSNKGYSPENIQKITKSHVPTTKEKMEGIYRCTFKMHYTFFNNFISSVF